MSLKLRLGNIATPGRVCSPHNEIYDCRIRPNGIGCLRWRSTRRRLGCRPAARPAGQEPVFRADPTSERNDLPIRSARFPIRANGKPPAGCNSGNAPKNERDEERRIPRALYYPSGGVPHPRATEPEMRPGRERSVRESGSALRSPGARKARATGLRSVRVGLFWQKRRANPEYLPNPITYFVTPAILGGVFGSYFPMAGNPLAWSRLENACTWHIRYINAYDRSAKYFSIPKPG